MSVPPPSWIPISTSTGSDMLLGEIGHARVERDDVRAQRGNRGENGAEDAGVDDRLAHRSRLIDADDDGRQLMRARPKPMRVSGTMTPYSG